MSITRLIVRAGIVGVMLAASVPPAHAQG